MKRPALKPSKVAMKRGGFLRVQKREDREVSKVVQTMKSKGPKMTPIRRAAKGQDCTLCIPGICNFDPDTTVLCHSNFLADGKGMGIKAPDEYACFGCAACHDVLDGRRPRPIGLTQAALENAFHNAMHSTHVVLRAKGLM